MCGIAGSINGSEHEVAEMLERLPQEVLQGYLSDAGFENLHIDL